MHVPSSCRLALATFGLLAICPSVRSENAALPKPKEFAILRGHTNAAWGLDLTPDALTVVSGSFDKTIKIWDIAVRRERLTLRGHSRCVEFVVVTPDGKTAVAADQTGVLRVWDLTAGRERAMLTEGGGRPAFLSLSRDGRTLSFGDHDDYLRQWDLIAIKQLEVAGGQRLKVHIVSGDGRLAAAIRDRRPVRLVQVLDVASGRVLTTVPAREPFAFSPDGKTLFATDDVTGDSAVKSSIFVVGILIALVVLWYMGYAEKFLGSWATWANSIGYFQ